jgi:hypothetical protein
MPLGAAHRVPDIVFGLDHGVGHFVAMTFQKGLQPGSFLAIFSHDMYA